MFHQKLLILLIFAVYSQKIENDGLVRPSELKDLQYDVCDFHNQVYHVKGRKIQTEKYLQCKDFAVFTVGPRHVPMRATNSSIRKRSKLLNFFISIAFWPFGEDGKFTTAHSTFQTSSMQFPLLIVLCNSLKART